MKLKPILDGVIVNVPFGTPLNVNAPEASTVVVAPPVLVSVAPLASAAGVIVPLIVTGCAVKSTAVTFAPLTVIAWLDGVKVKPAFVGVTV